jgi:PTS system fructose-specific IIA component
MTALITEQFVEIDLDAKDRHDATRILAQRLAASGRVTDLEGFLADIAAREEQMATGIEGGIGIPHARSAHVTVPTLGFARSTGGVEWGAPDGPAHLIFLIAAPDGGGAEHTNILAKLARKLVNAQVTSSLHSAADEAAVVAIITEAVGR